MPMYTNVEYVLIYRVKCIRRNKCKLNRKHNYTHYKHALNCTTYTNLILVLQPNSLTLFTQIAVLNKRKTTQINKIRCSY